jgi:hypothetical protein
MFQQRRMPVFLRLIAAALAATGLLGHGIAMLLVGLLASPVSAQPDARYFGEICTPDGVFRLAALGPADSEQGLPGDTGGQHGDPLNGCPVCSAYAQIGTADLPVSLVAQIPECCAAAEIDSQDGVARAFTPSGARPRAPPAVA